MCEDMQIPHMNVQLPLMSWFHHHRAPRMGGEAYLMNLNCLIQLAFYE